MGKLWYMQYRSIDGNWYDSGVFDNLEDAKRVYDGSRRKENYRIVQRVDKVVWPVDMAIDPASSGGA